MSREIDRSAPVINRVLPAQAEPMSRARDNADRLPEEQWDRNARFNPGHDNPVSDPAEVRFMEESVYIEQALSHMRQKSKQKFDQDSGLDVSQPAEYVADPQVQKTSSGAVAVYLHQQYNGIPIFMAAPTVFFSPDGKLDDDAGNIVNVAHHAIVPPKLSVQEAVLRAAQRVAVPDEDERARVDQFGEPLGMPTVDLSEFKPVIIDAFSYKNEQPTILEAGPFGDEIKASLVWVPVDDDLRLAWEVLITMPDYDGQYRTIVDAENGEILYCRQIGWFLMARGHVHPVDGKGQREWTSFPQTLTDFKLPIPSDLPPNFPDMWVEADMTVGNCTRAYLKSSGLPFRCINHNGVLTFDPTDPMSDEQSVLNAFYFSCYMHDYCYLLGFREANGNFQQNNFGRGGKEHDPVDVQVRPFVRGTASITRSTIDGTSPIMKLGSLGSTNRHAALDSSVVFHEFMHGVTSRLVGGAGNDRVLEKPQSRGMGEGWSDYIACVISTTSVVGAWIMDNINGIRRQRYDEHFQGNFGDLGTSHYQEEHHIGEIWCAVLMEMNRKIGATLSVQLVMDSLKLLPDNPDFIDGRNKILAALGHKQATGELSPLEYLTAKKGIWAAFAKFGIGENARADKGPELSGIVADFTEPPDQLPPASDTKAVGSDP
jgi:extracellular elastinolytic metalloproteinase